MPRQSRIVATNTAHHITQRGNNRQRVFSEPSDYFLYSHWINTYANRYKMDIISFCLMPNHVHFIAIPRKDTAFAKTFNTVNTLYAQYMNKKKQACGHLWQGRYFSCAMEDSHLYRAIRYVEQNPVRAGLTKHPWDYPWSSGFGRLDHTRKPVIDIQEINLIENWQNYLTTDDPLLGKDIQTETLRGGVLGSMDFKMALEKRLARSIIGLPQGRPKKDRGQRKREAVPVFQ